MERSNERVVLMDSEVNEVILSKRHAGMNEIIYGTQFKKIIVNNIIFQVNSRDSCFTTDEGKIVILKNTVYKEDDVILVGNIFRKVTDFYTYPLKSSELGIVKVSQLDDNKFLFTLESIVAKCWLIPSEDEYVRTPLLHTIPLYKQNIRFFMIVNIINTFNFLNFFCIFRFCLSLNNCFLFIHISGCYYCLH